MRSVSQRLKEWAVSGVTQDIRDDKQWAADNIPRGIAHIVEKWIGFWLAFLFATLFGGVGLVIIEATRQGSDVPILTDMVLWAVSRIWSLGVLVLFVSGLWILGVVVVSVVRVLLWLRAVWTNFWDKHTPRYTDSDSKSDTPKWPPSDDEEDDAWTKMWAFIGYGSLLFMGIMYILLWLELNYPNQLHAAVSSPELSSVSDVVNAALWVVNIEGLFGTVSANVSQAWVVYAILLFVIPGIFFAVAGRNLLFLTESLVRNDIETVAEKGVLSLTGLRLAGYFVASSVLALGIVSQFLLNP